MDIESVRKQHEQQLMDLPNVTMVAIGKKGDKDVIKVYVTHKVSKAELSANEIVPESLDGYETDVEESGPISAEAM